ncbi:Rne/Rng family ribonuclease [Plantactinospora sp. KLBMP9567]|uniref:Rne/Rng family ribonuclease n=1 Tax=Plantactinospora sp. KLBMP9567 TaxID=3085900 RepID=UPI0029825E78|nr:Rne/Rng family ribonuclease [Plantactinospora sp. KLBMP9567]MDW5327340.1 Rne/Rng family ribonuclease [Plantactinospora sp. KLBMP9567]MDW5330686.1 Rne/Rng family ribonuclease [Plantactinospora sp. KLBMP9567]
MLENEPEGGERTGAQPAVDATTANGSTESTSAQGATGESATAQGGSAESTAAQGGSAESTTAQGGSAEGPTRRRTTRRRTSSTTSEPAPTGVPAEAPSTARTTSGEASDAEVLAPVAADIEAAPKATRRRRKATTADKKDDTGLPAAEASAATDPGTPAAGPDDAAVEPVPPVKVTRTRRKKAAAAPPAEPTETTVTPPGAAESAPAAGELPVTGSDVGAPATPESTGGAGRPVAAGPAGAEPAAEETPRGRRRRAALSAPTVLFMAPEPETPPARAGVVEPVPSTRPTEAEAEGEPVEPVEGVRRRRRGRRAGEPAVLEAEPEAEAEGVADEEALDVTDAEEDEDEETAAARRRRRRGRRGRGRGKGTADDAEEGDEPEAGVEAGADEDEDDEGDAGDGVTRRRRRRRRKGAGDTDGAADDGVPTVIKIREPRKTVDEVQGVSGSTRLEAKRQRRRDGREQRRTRPPILSESEFLARREAVDRVMAVRQRGDRTQIAVLEDGVLVEHYVTRASAGTMAGNVYLGKVQNVLPSMEAAFVDVGRGRNAVLYAGEVNWDTTGLEGRARSIEQALRSGDSVLVQVTKDPIGHKGARLTSHIALSGRHLVYVPHGNASGISRKLPDTERKRLRDILKKLVPDGAGVIVRTAAEGASEDELARDVKRLQAQWEDIQAKAAEGGAPVLLYEEPDLVIRVVRDLFNEDFRELVVQGDESYDMVESYLSHVSPDLVPRLRRQTGTADVFAERRIDEQILKGLDRKVFLPSGGHLVIDRTEAMTVIDVNTGKYTGAGGNLEETVTRNNLEAAEEIVRQLRLRDLGGIVVIDFIDMVLESNRELVLRRLTECLGRDRTKHQVTEITSLGLVQMTRKRIGAGLLEAFSETCDCCKGRGVIIHTEPVSEKSRSGAGDKVKAVASATGTPAPASEAPAVGGRRRGRKAAAPERVVVEVSEYDDTMGYDLSRYEAEPPEADDVVEAAPAESMRLAGAGDPDGIEDTGDLDAEAEAAEIGGGRRRARRGGTRRRTRP